MNKLKQLIQSKVKSASNKLTSFPQWHEMDQSLEASLTAITKRQSHFAIAQGPAYAEFSRKLLNDSISEILLKIDEQLKALQEKVKEGTDVVPKVRSDLMKLRPLNDDIRNKKKNTAAAKDRAEKSSKNAERCEKKVELLRLKNPSSPDFARAQDEYDRAVKQKQNDATAAEEREALFQTEVKEYRKQLFQTVLQALAMYAQAKQASAQSMEPFGDEIAELAKTIPPYTDPTIESLEKQVEDIRNEPAE